MLVNINVARLSAMDSDQWTIQSTQTNCFAMACFALKTPTSHKYNMMAEP